MNFGALLSFYSRSADRSGQEMKQVLAASRKTQRRPACCHGEACCGRWCLASAQWRGRARGHWRPCGCRRLGRAPGFHTIRNILNFGTEVVLA